MDTGPVKHITNIRFRTMDDFESYINALDIDYDSGDGTFTGYVSKLKPPQFKTVRGSAYAEATNYMQEIIEYHGQNCYIPTCGKSFINVIIILLKKLSEEFQDFIRTEQRRTIVMTSARSQPVCKNFNIDIGCFDGTRINPRNITQRNIAIKIHTNPFCLTWNSNDNSFTQAIKERKDNFKVVDNVKSDKQVKSFFKYEYKPKTVQYPLTNKVVYDLETYNKDRGILCCSCIYKLSKISGKYNRDISEKENQKCLNDRAVFKGTDCFNEKSDHVSSFKGESK